MGLIKLRNNLWITCLLVPTSHSFIKRLSNEPNREFISCAFLASTFAMPISFKGYALMFTAAYFIVTLIIANAYIQNDINQTLGLKKSGKIGTVWGSLVILGLFSIMNNPIINIAYLLLKILLCTLYFSLGALNPTKLALSERVLMAASGIMMLASILTSPVFGILLPVEFIANVITFYNFAMLTLAIMEIINCTKLGISLYQGI